MPSDPVTDTIIESRFAEHPACVMLRFNRPQKKNALGPRDIAVLREKMLRLQTDAQTKLIVITGSGDAFCAGADIDELNDLSGDAMASFIDAQVDFLSQVVLSPKIVVAAVNGVSAGLGNHLTACCDLALVREDAVFHFTGAAKAIPSLLMGTLVLPMTIGLKRAKSIYLRGGKLDAHRALEYGFCNEVVARDAWDSALADLAAEFAGRNAGTMAHNKFQLNQGVYQMIGALKLSGIAGANTLSARSDLPTGKVR